MKKLLSSVLALTAVFVFTVTAFAATTVVVTPTNTQGWTTADTRPGGDVQFVADATAPGGDGALQLTTDATTTSKAQYMHETSTPIADVTNLGYYTFQETASFVGGAPSYQLPVMLNGTTGFTTFVYEPYQNGTVVPNTWQSWDVDAGQFWSSRSVTCSNGAVIAGGGGAPFYTLSQIQTMCPEAVVLGFGVNVGSNNPSYTVRTDLVAFNDTVYDFELVEPEVEVTLTNKDQCKKGGWMTSTNPEFKNQGQCVSYFQANPNAGKQN